MKFHNIHTMRVDDCQEMLMTGDYMKMCRSNTINPLIKYKAKNKYSEFIDELAEMFSGEDISGKIDSATLIQGMKLKLNQITMLKDALKLCYNVKNTPEKIKTLDSLNKVYRSYFFDYPKPISDDLSVEEQTNLIESNLKPITSEIRRLEYKIKELTPKQKEVSQEQENLGLLLHISFIEAVENNGYLNKSMTVHELNLKYNEAVKKNDKLKLEQNG